MAERTIKQMPKPEGARNSPCPLRPVLGQPADGLVWCVVGLWLAMSLVGLWWYQARAADASRATVFEVRQPQLVEKWFQETVAGRGVEAREALATVVSLSTPDCACEAISAGLASVAAIYKRRGVRFLNASPPAFGNDGVSESKAASPLFVFDRQGRLSYYGPYAEAAMCGAGRNLIEPVLERVLKGHVTKPVPVVGPACACT